MKVKTFLGQIADGLRHERAGAADKSGVDYALRHIKPVIEVIGEVELPALDIELAASGGDRLAALIMALRREHKRLKEYNLGWGADVLRSVQGELARAPSGQVQKAAAGETLEARVGRMVDKAARKVADR